MQRLVSASTGAVLLLSLAKGTLPRATASSGRLPSSAALNQNTGWIDDKPREASTSSSKITCVAMDASRTWEAALFNSFHARDRTSSPSSTTTSTRRPRPLWMAAAAAASSSGSRAITTRGERALRSLTGGGESGRRPSSSAGARRPTASSPAKGKAAAAAARRRREQQQGFDEEIDDSESHDDNGGVGSRARGGVGGSRSGDGRGGGGREWEDDEDGLYDSSEEYGSEYDDDDEDDELGGLSDEGRHRGATRMAERSAPTSFTDEDGIELYDSHQDDDFYEDDEDGDYGGYSEDSEFGDEASSDDEDSYRGRPRQGFPSPGRGYGGGGAGGRGRGPARRGGPRRQQPPARMQRLKARFADAQTELKTKMSGVTHKGAKVIRELKGSVSSDLEKTLIKATRPDNDPAKRKHVNLLLQAAEHAFPAYMDPEDDGLAYWREGPYWMTLHKLWRRMAEKDYRTATKAVYVLHRLARGTTSESWDYFRMTLVQMRREEDKGTKSRYFSRRVVRTVDADGQPYSAWLDKYADFALLRLQSFAPDLSELASVNAGTTHGDASRSLEKAELLIEAALACELGSDLDNDVTCDCLKLVIEDLCELWSLFQQKLELRLQQRFAEGGFSRDELRRTLGFLEYYLEHLPRARDLVHESHRMLALYSHAVPRDLGNALATDMLQEQVTWIREELTTKAAKASAGKLAPTHDASAAVVGRSSPSVKKGSSKKVAGAAPTPKSHPATTHAAAAAAAATAPGPATIRQQKERSGAASPAAAKKKANPAGASAVAKKRPATTATASGKAGSPETKRKPSSSSANKKKKPASPKGPRT